jgi:acetate kinase
VTLHLESGCSACAIKNGRSVETSMGFTPLEGLVMGMRCGDIDPALVGYLARQERISVEEVDEILNKKSGLKGLSGVSHDTRELEKHLDDEHVRLAMDVFCHRLVKYIGAYLAVLEGPRAIVFGGNWGGLAVDPGADLFGLWVVRSFAGWRAERASDQSRGPNQRGRFAFTRARDSHRRGSLRRSSGPAVR